MIDTTPSCTLVVMCLRPCSGASAFSSLRATSVSSCEGATPGRLAVTEMVGTSRSGKFCTFMDPKAMKPATVSSTNSMTAGIGLRIDHEETLIMASLYLVAGAAERAEETAVSTTRTVSPWFKNAPPLATTRASGFRPRLTSTRSPLWRPVCTLSWLTF